MVKFKSSPYTLQEDMTIYSQLLNSCKNICGVNYYSPVNMSYSYYVSL